MMELLGQWLSSVVGTKQVCSIVINKHLQILLLSQKVIPFKKESLFGPNMIPFLITPNLNCDLSVTQIIMSLNNWMTWMILSLLNWLILSCITIFSQWTVGRMSSFLGSEDASTDYSFWVGGCINRPSLKYDKFN